MLSSVPVTVLRCAALACVLCVAAAAQASSRVRVMLVNGDQITGKVLSQGDDSITLYTRAAGVIEIRRSEVKDVVSLEEAAVSPPVPTTPAPPAVTVAAATPAAPPVMVAAVRPATGINLPKYPCANGTTPVLDSWTAQLNGSPDKVVLGTQSQIQVGGTLGLGFCEGSKRDKTLFSASGSHSRSYKLKSTAVETDIAGAQLEQDHYFHRPTGAYVFGIGQFFSNSSLGIAQEPSGGIGLGSPRWSYKSLSYNFTGDIRYVGEHLDHTSPSLNLAGLKVMQQAHLQGSLLSWDEQVWVMPMLNDRQAVQAYATLGPSLAINSWFTLSLTEEENYVDNAPKPNRRNYLASTLSLKIIGSGRGPK